MEIGNALTPFVCFDAYADQRQLRLASKRTGLLLCGPAGLALLLPMPCEIRRAVH